MRLELKIEQRGINPYVFVGAEYASQLKPGWRQPMPVRVQVNGKPDEPWRVNMMPKGDGGYFLYLAGPVRRSSRTQVGDTAVFSIEFDDEYQPGPIHSMPAWFSVGLNETPLAKAGWDRLPPSRKKELLRYFSRLKSDEAIARNLQQSLAVLSGKPGRFMARDWNNGFQGAVEET